MGKTYRKQKSYDDEKQHSNKGGNHPRHSNNKKIGGMRLINDVFDEDENYFDENVRTTDSIVINKNDGKTS